MATASGQPQEGLSEFHERTGDGIVVQSHRKVLALVAFMDPGESVPLQKHFDVGNDEIDPLEDIVDREAKKTSGGDRTRKKTHRSAAG